MKGILPTTKGKFLVLLTVWILACFHGLIKVHLNQ